MNGCIYRTADNQCEKFTDRVRNTLSWCVDGPCEYAKPSNADKIRSMTDEALVEWIWDFNEHFAKRSEVEEWLRREAET